MQIIVRRASLTRVRVYAGVTVWVTYARTNSPSKKEKWGVGQLMAQAARTANAVYIGHTRQFPPAALRPSTGRFRTRRVGDKKRPGIRQTS